MKNGKIIQEGTEQEITQRVDGCVWKCVVSENEAECLSNRCIVSNIRRNGEKVELRIISNQQPAAGAVSVESTLEDAYLYHIQTAEEA